MFRTAAAAARRATSRLNARFAGPVVEKNLAKPPPLPASRLVVVQKRSLSDSAKQIEEKYGKGLSILHWLIAGGFGVSVFTVGSTSLFVPTFKLLVNIKSTVSQHCFLLLQVQYKNFTDDKKLKGILMNAHKSFGLLLFGLAIPRIAIRLTSTVPKHLPAPAWQVTASKISHYALYGVLIIMPTSGIAMGYFGGKGLPFFGAHIPGAETPNGQIAKNAFNVRLVRMSLPLCSRCCW